MNSKFRRLFALAVAVSGLGLVLAACTGPERTFCPRIAVLDQAGTITKFAPGTQNVMFTAEITDMKLKCEVEAPAMTQLTVEVDATFVFRRGPAMQGDSVEVPYFVVITDRRGNLLTKQEFKVRARFGNAAQVQVTDGTWTLYRLARAGSGLAFETWLGFQLTEAELAYNRTQRGVK